MQIKNNIQAITRHPASKTIFETIPLIIATVVPELEVPGALGVVL